MPIYEYACGKCGHEFEVEQRITDDPIKTCPECRSRKVKKLISQTSFVLKGGGWYSDLYSSSDGKKDKDADKADKPDKAAASDDKAKPEKTEKKSSGGDDKGGKKGKGKKAAA
ncbi:MAG: FmdB family zinc ribbon protein [Myxococcota bacterium]